MSSWAVGQLGIGKLMTVDTLAPVSQCILSLILGCAVALVLLYGCPGCSLVAFVRTVAYHPPQVMYHSPITTATLPNCLAFNSQLQSNQIQPPLTSVELAMWDACHWPYFSGVATLFERLSREISFRAYITKKGIIRWI